MRKIVEIEQKSFEIQTDYISNIAAIQIKERGRGFSDRIKIREDDVKWVCECLHQAVRWLDMEKFPHTKDEGNRGIILQIRWNQRAGT